MDYTESDTCITSWVTIAHETTTDGAHYPGTPRILMARRSSNTLASLESSSSSSPLRPARPRPGIRNRMWGCAADEACTRARHRVD